LLASILLIYGTGGLDEKSMSEFYASPWLAWTEIITGIVIKEKNSDNRLLCPGFEDLNKIKRFNGILLEEYPIIRVIFNE